MKKKLAILLNDRKSAFEEVMAAEYPDIEIITGGIFGDVKV